MTEKTELFTNEQDRDNWQRAEIEAGLAEADLREFASPEEVVRIIGKYVSRAQ